MLKAWGKARGDKDNPVSYQDVVEKFGKLTAGQLDSGRQAQIVETCAKLDTMDDIAALIDPLRTR